MKKILLTLTLCGSAFFTVAHAESVSVCMEKIEADSHLPKGTFNAMMMLEKGTMSVEKAKTIHGKEKLYGPIGLNERAVKLISKKSGIPEEKIKTDDCTNFSAVAFLMNKKGKDQPLSVKFENYHGRYIPVYNKKANYLIAEINKNEHNKNDL